MRHQVLWPWNWPARQGSQRNWILYSLTASVSVYSPDDGSGGGAFSRVTISASPETCSPMPRSVEGPQGLPRNILETRTSTIG
jgi:hypothetical protein